MNLSVDGGGLFLFILVALSHFTRELMTIVFLKATIVSHVRNKAFLAAWRNNPWGRLCFL
jgi:hypothetical protein